MKNADGIEPVLVRFGEQPAERLETFTVLLSGGGRNNRQQVILQGRLLQHGCLKNGRDMQPCRPTAFLKMGDQRGGQSLICIKPFVIVPTMWIVVVEVVIRKSAYGVCLLKSIGIRIVGFDGIAVEQGPLHNIGDILGPRAPDRTSEARDIVHAYAYQNIFAILLRVDDCPIGSRFEIVTVADHK